MQTVSVIPVRKALPIRAWFVAALVLICLSIATYSRPACAQTTQLFVGHVADPSGAAVPNATITIHNEGTGEDVVTKTTGAGDYTAPYIKPGLYTITATETGFKAVSKTHIRLDIDQNSKIDFTMPIGGMTETVTVSSEGSQIELSKADRGDIIDAQRVQELPLDGRNPLMLASLAPGITNTENPQFTRMQDNVGQQLHGNAVKDAALAENLDGTSNDTENGYTGFVPPVDSVSEFKVVVNPYDASYGRAGGAAVDISLKSGTNNIHGDVYEFARRSWLDANAFQNDYNFANNGVYAKPNHKRDLFGFEADGPVRIPWLYNGTDKTFFTVQYEEAKENLPNTGASINSVPNPAWTTGNFAGATYYNTTTKSLMPLIIYDPFSPLVPVVDPNDGKTKLAHTAFPGNIIPATCTPIAPATQCSHLDPVGVALAQIYNGITPNYNPGAGNAPYQNNLFHIGIENDLARTGLIKLDQNFGSRDRGTLRWGGEERYAFKNQNGVPDDNPGNQTFHQRQPKSQTFALEEVHTFSPNMILDNKVSVLTQQQGLIPGTGQTRGNFLPGLNFSQHFIANAFRTDMIPHTSASGYVDLGNGGPGSYNDAHSLIYQPSITLIHGRHSIRAGFDMRLQQYSLPGGGNNTQFSYNSGFTQEFYNSSDASGYQSGNAIASLVLGDPNSGSLQYPVSPFYSQHYYAMWAQDDWKVTPKLTLNFGLRYDLPFARTERYNKMNYAFDRTTQSPLNTNVNSAALINPITHQALGPLLGGIQFTGTNTDKFGHTTNNPRSAYDINLVNIQPRFGMAYAFSSRTSLRAGFGEMFINNEANDSQNGFQATTNYTSSLDNNVTPYGHLSDPFPATPSNPGGTLRPTNATLGLATTPGGSVNFTDPHYRIPSLWEYSVSLSQLVTRRDSLEIAYSGTRAYNLGASVDLNHISPAWNAQCDVERGGNRHICDDNATGQVNNPFYQDPDFVGTNYYAPQKISGSNLTRPFPAFTSVSKDNSNLIHQWYNSLQVVASHNASKELTLHFAYTWSKIMTTGFIFDQVDQLVERRLGSNDIPQALSLSGVFYVPVGRGKALLGHTNHIVDALVGGWEVSPLYVYTQGVPWSPGNNWQELSPVGIHVHDIAPNANHTYKRLQGVTPCVAYRDVDGVLQYGPTYSEANCTSPALIRQTPNYNLPQNFVYWGVRVPAFHEFDASVSKSFAWSDRIRLQTRVDLLNVLNHPVFNNGYNSDPTSKDWGSIQKGPQGPANPPRYIQLSGKLIF
ncbi:MAG TPA: TonB-dependent receptor [Acidobacteriaceae bacterium]|nr:TonB-dependent receptor [Acidobacteriaceae bacterium]